jgi:peroxiredoxin
MITTILILLILVSLWIGFYQIVKQQGRILLRLDQIERSAQAAEIKPEKPVEEAEPVGLPLETVFPAFSFPDASGKTVALGEFRGKRVLLVHWNFQCGFCGSISPELTRLEAAFEKQSVQLVLLASGDAQSNRDEAAKHGLRCPVLLRSGREIAGPFEHEGTPVAYLLDADGRVAAPVARGKDRVLSLALDLAGEKTGVPSSDELRSQLGTDFPAFQFPDLQGGMVALGDFRGHRVLLLHWNFDCGFCSALAPELARFEARLEERNVRLVLLAKGEAESNRERAAALGLTCRILLLQGREKPQPFEHRGTPVAYLLDEEGRIAAPFASGRDEVLALARQAAGNEAGAPQSEVAESRGIDLSGRPPQAQTLERHRVKLPGFIVRGEIGLGDVIKRMTSAIGIKPCVGCERRAAFLNRWMAFSGSGGGTLQPGKRAPVFRLPDLQGRVVSLEEYQGRRVLLVFSDPRCGPCDELAPHLVRLHREHEKNGLAVILVGRGHADENRHKAEQHGFQFPVVLQKKQKLSKEYGTIATPAAFLIGEDGVIAKDAAVGRDAILALARGGGG